MADSLSTRTRRKLLAAAQLLVRFLALTADGFEEIDGEGILSLDLTLDWWRDEYHNFKDEVRYRGIWRSLYLVPYIFIFVPVSTIFLWVFLVVGYFIFNTLGLARFVNRCSSSLRQQEQRQDTLQFRRQFFQQDAPRKSTAPVVSVSEVAAALEPSRTGFFSLPPEIRRSILVHTFGGRTMHMSLAFRHPFFLARDHRDGDHRVACHARIERYVAVGASHLQTDKPKAWEWFGCVCHRAPYSRVGGLRSYGAFWASASDDFDRAYLGRRELDERDARNDRCLQGVADCRAWPGKWPDKCQIGVMGWLLACKQAYVEGFDVLYRTNTIHIASIALLRDMHCILRPAILSHLTSLELAWDLDSISFDDALVTKGGDKAQKEPPRPIFPSLASLRIVFGKDSTAAKAYRLDRHAINQRQIRNVLYEELFPAIDVFLDRAVPPSADVVVSCPAWRWFTSVDFGFFHIQGEQASRPQRAEMGGVKFWRQTSNPGENGEKSAAQGPDEVALGAKEQRLGFWVHSEDRPLTERQELTVAENQGRVAEYLRSQPYRRRLTEEEAAAEARRCALYDNDDLAGPVSQ